MIKDGDQIMLDASSTSLYVVRQIKQLSNITIITNSIEILLELGDKTGWTILSTGGTLREGAYSLSGSSAERMIRDHHVDLAICSAKGLDTNMGITESNEKDAEMKKAIFNAASTRILAIDHTKFDNISFNFSSFLAMIHRSLFHLSPSHSTKVCLANKFLVTSKSSGVYIHLTG